MQSLNPIMNHTESPTTTTLTALRLLAHGKVQGVYYRVSAQAEAQRLGLQGWVRNLRSGEVEMLVAGTQNSVALFCSWAQRGPERAVVSRVDVTEVTLTETLPTPFEVRETV